MLRFIWSVAEPIFIGRVLPDSAICDATQRKSSHMVPWDSGAYGFGGRLDGRGSKGDFNFKSPLGTGAAEDRSLASFDAGFHDGQAQAQPAVRAHMRHGDKPGVC